MRLFKFHPQLIMKTSLNFHMKVHDNVSNQEVTKAKLSETEKSTLKVYTSSIFIVHLSELKTVIAQYLFTFEFQS